MRRLGNIPLISARPKMGYVPHPSKGSYTEESLVARRARSALAHGAKSFDYMGETYVRRGDRFVPWWTK
jgi:hypothetical protein